MRTTSIVSPFSPLRPSVSVIIPVYNVEKYLKECLDSVLAQDFKDFELILVDDGSKDSSGEICDRYAKKDTRIRVFHKSNGGVSSARNLGLDNARGEWIAFVDSDDTVDRDYLSSMVAHTDLPDLKMVQFGLRRTASSECGVRRCNHQSEIVKAEEYVKRILVYDINPGPMSKLFKTNNIDIRDRGVKIRFDENLRIGEDLVFLLKYICENRADVYYDNRAIYNYRFVPTSAMHQKDLTEDMIKLNHAVTRYTSYTHTFFFPTYLDWFKAINLWSSFAPSFRLPSKQIFSLVRDLNLISGNEVWKRVKQYHAIAKYGKFASDMFLCGLFSLRKVKYRIRLLMK